MALHVHLTFDGRCEAAFAFYAQTFGGRVGAMLRYGDTPMASKVPPGWRDKIVHGSITIGAQMLAGADLQPADYRAPQGVYVLVGAADLVEARRVFDALAAGGVVHMPLAPTFWSPGFGVVVDAFGTPWEISCEQAPAP